MFILLNGASDSLILYRFWNISHLLLSSFSEMSNGLCLSFVAFPSLIAHSIMLWSKLILMMFLQSPVNFLISSTFLSLYLGFIDMIMFSLQFCLSFSSLSLFFSDLSITSLTVLFSSVSMISVQLLPSPLFSTSLFISFSFSSTFFWRLYSSIISTFCWMAVFIDFIF